MANSVDLQLDCSFGSDLCLHYLHMSFVRIFGVHSFRMVTILESLKVIYMYYYYICVRIADPTWTFAVCINIRLFFFFFFFANCYPDFLMLKCDLPSLMVIVLKFQPPKILTKS